MIIKLLTNIDFPPVWSIIEYKWVKATFIWLHPKGVLLSIGYKEKDSKKYYVVYKWSTISYRLIFWEYLNKPKLYRFKCNGIDSNTLYMDSYKYPVDYFYTDRVYPIPTKKTKIRNWYDNRNALWHYSNFWDFMSSKGGIVTKLNTYDAYSIML